MYSLCWVCSHVEVFLGPNDVDIFAVVNCLAQEGHILQGKYGEVLVLDVIPQHILGLQIKATLPEYCAHVCAILKEGLYLLQDVHLGLGGGTY